MILNNTLVTENSCVSSLTACLGGGIANENLSSGTLIMTNSQVTNNTATATGTDATAIGAGIGIGRYFFVSITDSTISGNTGTGTGAGGSLGNGLYLANDSEGQVNITNSAFTDNKGMGSGAADGSGITLSNSQTMTGTFNNVTISGNQGNSRGAGLLVQDSGASFTLNINNSSITNNTGGAYGGGVMIAAFGSFYAGTPNVNFLNTTISGNSASTHGGGVALWGFNTNGGANAKVNFLNTTISGNSTLGTGGGAYIVQTSAGAMTANFNYSTIANNTANFSSGGGIYAWTGTANLKNSVVAGNLAPIGPDLSGTVNSQNYNHIGDLGNDVIINGNTANNGTGPAMLGPLQVNGSGLPTHLPLSGSPVIDKIPKNISDCGMIGFLSDARSISRPQAGRCEMGATEVFFPAGPFGLGGSVRTADGFPIRNVLITITGGALPNGSIKIYTGSFGTFFANLPGAVYTVTVKSRRYTISSGPQTVTLDTPAPNVDFVADPESRMNTGTKQFKKPVYVRAAGPSRIEK